MYQNPSSIFAAIRAERDDFLYNQIEIVDGVYFNQYETIKKIHKYLNGHYVNGDYETINGVRRKKVFWKLGKRQAAIASKQLDIDVKDFLLIAENPDHEWNTFLLEKELKYWLKKHDLGVTLNQIVDELPEYGSVVLRKVKNGAKIMDLRYLFNDQAAESLKEARYINYKHLMSPDDLRKMKDWEHVDHVIDHYCLHSDRGYEDGASVKKDAGSPLAEVWESFAIRPRSYLTNKGFLKDSKEDDQYVLCRFIVAGVDDRKENEAGQAYDENGLILFAEELSELPFKEVHYKKTKGRWIGVGVIEETFEEQRMVNKIKDQEDKAAELASMILYQTQDKLVQKNLLSDVDNGEILTSKTGIQRLDNRLDVNQFENLVSSYENHADRVTFAQDIMGGDLPPASATATAVVNQVQQATSVYDYKKENIGLFLREFIDDLVFPELKTKLNKQHTFRFVGNPEEMQRIREKAANYHIKELIEKGEIIEESELTAAKEQFITGMQEQGSRIWIDVQKDFFNNLDYEVSLEITGEGKNVQAQLQNLQFVMSLVGQNPEMVLKNPVLKRLLTKTMSLMGLSTTELENAFIEQQEQMDQQKQDQMDQMMMQQQMKTQALQLPTETPQLTQQL